MTMNESNWIAIATEVLTIEAEAVRAQIPGLDRTFIHACELILATRGHVIVTGMGKSGHISAKLAATLASTGTPAFFLHPAEAGHGDLGMITRNDLLFAVSYSGESQEIMTMIPIVKEMKVPVIAMTADSASAMAQSADVHLHLKIDREACPLKLAPTSSTTATLALGDAIAVAVMRARDFSREDFARSHPFGKLGRRLCTKVSHVMRKGDELPINQADDNVKEAVIQISQKRLGATLIVEGHTLIGIYTDGDLRRTLEHHADPLTLTLRTVMTKNPHRVSADMLAVEALQIMKQHQITVLPVITEGQLQGLVHIHDLLVAGIA